MPKDTFSSRRAIIELRNSEYDRYRLYDRNVDIVSCFEALFVEQEEMRQEVEHFERFPQCDHPDKERATPDFTIVFRNGTAIIAEIANFPREDRGVDSLCRQLLRYDSLASVPTVGGKQMEPSAIDVLYLAPFNTGNDPIDRIIQSRQNREVHFYKPSRPPIVVSFSNDGDKYTFTRNRDPRNGRFRNDLVQRFIDSKYSAPGSFWTPTKVSRPFFNDEPPVLYTACIVWLKVLPTLYAGEVEFVATVDKVVETLRDFYGYGKRKVVRDVFSLFVKAGLAKVADSRDAYAVKRNYRRTGDDDFAQTLLDRVYPASVQITRAGDRSRRPPASRGRVTKGQYSLFDSES